MTNTQHSTGRADLYSGLGQLRHCQAPLDDRQRYCVACGTRRPQADDPVARYFASASRRARAAQARRRLRRRAGPQRADRGRLALLPVAAAIGVLVGGSADNSDAGGAEGPEGARRERRRSGATARGERRRRRRKKKGASPPTAR